MSASGARTGAPGRARARALAGAPVVVAASLALAFWLLHMAWLDRAHPDALYMDSLRLLHQLQEWRAGRIPFLELWGAGTAHRGFINQAALLANLHLFSVDVLLANRLTGVATGLVAFTLALAFNRQLATTDEGTIGLLVRWGVSLLIVALCFSLSGFELFTLDLGLPLWTKNLCFVLFFAAHARFMAGDAGPARLGPALLLAMAGGFIVVFIGMGWSYAFAGAVCAVHLLVALAGVRRGEFGWLRIRALPTLGVLLALAVSLSQGGTGGAGEDEDAFGLLLAALPTMLELAVQALGSAWIGAEVLGDRGWPLSVAAWLGVASVLLATVALVARLRRGLRTGSLLPIHLLGYGALTALSLAAARGEGGALAVMASRYYMDLLLFLVGLLWLLAEHAMVTRHRVPACLVLLATGAGLALLLGVTFDREWKVAPYRALSFEAMNQALLLGVPGNDEARLLQSPLEHARKGADILRRQGLGPFAGLGNPECDAARVVRVAGWHAPEGEVVWMQRTARLQVPPCGCGLEARLHLPDGFPERTLHAGSAAGEAVELALVPGTTTTLVLPPAANGEAWDLSVSRATVPATDLPDGRDGRELGVLWSGQSFPCAAGDAP